MAQDLPAAIDHLCVAITATLDALDALTTEHLQAPARAAVAAARTALVDAAADAVPDVVP